MEDDSSWQMTVVFSEEESMWEPGNQGLLYINVRCLPNIQGDVQ